MGSTLVPGAIEVCAAPETAAATPAAGLHVSDARFGSRLSKLDIPIGVRLAALRAVRSQLNRKLAEIAGGSCASDQALARDAQPGTGAHMALVRACPANSPHPSFRKQCASAAPLAAACFSDGSTDDPHL